jgi:hypothetical protein
LYQKCKGKSSRNFLQDKRININHLQGLFLLMATRSLLSIFFEKMMKTWPTVHILRTVPYTRR